MLQESERKLLFYVESPFVSGAEAQIIRNVRTLADEGVNLLLVAALGSGDIASKFNTLSVFKRPKVSEVKLLFPRVRNSVATVLVDQLRFLTGVARGFSIAKKYLPTVIHVNNGGFPGAAGARGFGLGARLALKEASLVMTVNNMAVDYSSIARKLDYLFDRSLALSVSTWVTGSKAASARLSKVLNLNSAKTLAIPNGIPPLTCQAPHNCPEAGSLSQFDEHQVALSVGLLEKRKGHSHLLSALGLLNAGDGLPANWVFLIEGTGAERRSLENDIKELGLSRQVQLLGSSKCLYHLMVRSDFFIHPSLSNEDLPNVITEAMALGKPIIGSRLAGIPEQIDDGVNGFLVEPGEVKELAAKIELLLRDSKLRETLGQASAVKYQLEFLPKVALESYRRLYGLDDSFEH